MPDKLILASSSPRRIELLKSCHISFEKIDHEFDENSLKIKNPVKLAMQLAKGKAQSIVDKKEFDKKKFNDSFILGVDTIVAINNKVLGKPKDKTEAEYFIRLLSGKTHRVISGIAIINSARSIGLVEHSISFIKFSKFSENFIGYYLKNKLYEGFAGGYAIQGIFNMFAEKIKGSYSNIIGLPVDVLYEMLMSVNFKFEW